MTAPAIDLTAYDQPEEYTVLSFVDVPIDLSDLLVPLETAQPGDLVGMISRWLVRGKRPRFRQLGAKMFCLMTADGLRRVEFEQLPDEIAARVIDALGRGVALNRPAFPIDLTAHGARDLGSFFVMHFADAAFSVGFDWVHDGFEGKSGPTIPEIRMRAASDIEAGNALRWKILRYVDVFRRLGFAKYSDRWNLLTPDLACLVDQAAWTRPGGN